MIRRIMFVTRFLSGGGAERVISVLANSLVEQGYEVGIMAYNVTPQDYPLDARVSRFTLENYAEDTGNPVSRTAFRWKHLRKAVKAYHPDVVLPFLEPLVRETFLTTRGLHIPMISAVRNKPVYHSALEKRLYDYFYAHSAAVFLQTESQKQFFGEKIVAKSFVVPNPISAGFIACGTERKERTAIRTIVTAGRLNPQKNHRLLIEAMAQVHRAHPECVLHIYGEGSERDGLQAQIDGLDAGSYIRLMGRSTDLAQVYADADLFVLSSDYEGMPNALAEAMAAGMPCISTDCLTGPKELIGDDQRGLLVPTGDAESMAAAMLRLIESPELAGRLGAAAHAYTGERFAPSQVALALVENCEQYIS